MPARHFHCSDGGSHKFWSVEVDGAMQTVRWGRIGTAGQELAKDYASPAEADAATARLITAKLRKGYAEVSPEEAARTAPRPSARSRPAAGRQLLLPLDGDEWTPAALPPARTPSPDAAPGTLALF